MGGCKKTGSMSINQYDGMDGGASSLQRCPTPSPTGSSGSNYNLLDLETALASFKAQASIFGVRHIHDGAGRLDYIRQTEFVAKTLIEEVQSGRLSPLEAAEEANKIRNFIMETARVSSSDIGRAQAQALKATGKSLQELEGYYAQKLFKSAFEKLTQADKTRYGWKLWKPQDAPDQR